MKAADVKLYDSPSVGGMRTRTLHLRREFSGPSMEAAMGLLCAYAASLEATDCVGVELSVDAESGVWTITGTPAVLEYDQQSPRTTEATWPTSE